MLVLAEYYSGCILPQKGMALPRESSADGSSTERVEVALVDDLAGVGVDLAFCAVSVTGRGDSPAEHELHVIDETRRPRRLITLRGRNAQHGLTIAANLFEGHIGRGCQMLARHLDRLCATELRRLEKYLGGRLLI